MTTFADPRPGLTQRWLLTAELAVLALFATVALIKGGAATPSLNWINPLHISSLAAPTHRDFFRRRPESPPEPPSPLPTATR